MCFEFTSPNFDTSYGIHRRRTPCNPPNVPDDHFPPSPRLKPKTRWQKFSEANNIKKRKRSRLVWDDMVQDWVPRWGKGSAKQQKRKIDEAIIELKPSEDLRTVVESRRAEEKLAKGKQAMREMRNKIEAQGGRLGLLRANQGTAALEKNTRKQNMETLKEVNRRAAVSNASYGVFSSTPVVPQKKNKNVRETATRGPRSVRKKNSKRTRRLE